MDVSRKTHDVTTKPKCYDLTSIIVQLLRLVIITITVTFITVLLVLL